MPDSGSTMMPSWSGFYFPSQQHNIISRIQEGTGQWLLDSELGRTSLWWAAAKGHEALVKLLLDTGKADVDSKDENGRTPLRWAERNEQETVVKLLQSSSIPMN